jgi:hypothetical protein
MNNGIGTNLFDQGHDSRAIAYVDFMVLKATDRFCESGLVPACVTLRAKEHCALIVVDTVDGPALACEVNANFRAD